MIRVLALLVDIVLVKRWNLLLGIPDKAFYLLGDAIIYQLCCAPLLCPCSPASVPSLTIKERPRCPQTRWTSCRASC